MLRDIVLDRWVHYKIFLVKNDLLEIAAKQSKLIPHINQDNLELLIFWGRF